MTVDVVGLFRRHPESFLFQYLEELSSSWTTAEVASPRVKMREAASSAGGRGGVFIVGP